MQQQPEHARTIGTQETLGRPLPAWTYSNAELFELEYDALFLSRWQLVGHENDVDRKSVV